VTVLLIANNFPPVRGGSAAVYGSLARIAAGRIVVLAPFVSYLDGLPLIGWREHDRQAPYVISRIRLLRTMIGVRPGAWPRLRLVAQDLYIRTATTLRILRLLRRYRPEAVCLGELLASSWMIRTLALVPRLRVLVYVHGEEITTGDIYDQNTARRRRALQAADRIIVVSRFTQDAVARLLGDAARSRIVLIENGVDTDRFKPSARNSDLVSCYDLAGMFVFVAVCRLVEKKGIDHALRAFARLLTSHPDSRFVIVGSGPYEDALHALADALGVTGAVSFVGDVAEHELTDYYMLGDVFIMPNRALPNGDTEGFGLVFLEANACGLPVIAGRDGGTGDAVRDGENGLLVDGNSIDAIHAAMQRLRSDDALRHQIAQAGLRAAAAADWKIKAKQFLQACEDRP
jgi:phosphatidylinositol alpha-1,6-mannosyltransferase